MATTRPVVARLGSAWHAPYGLLVVALLAGLGSGPDALAQERRHSRQFPPAMLGELEGPDREAWQKPDVIMDALGIFDGSSVADLGAGGGWFTVRLARRVGPTGRVYAQDIQKPMIESMNRRFQREGLRNVTTVLGTEEDASLDPGSVNAVLIVGVYGELAKPVELLKTVRKALRPGGRIGVVDFRKDGLGPGPDTLEERVDEAVVIKDAEAAGLRLVDRTTPLPFQYLLIFVDAAPSAGRARS
jgi:ubiquinone/menaquinone biosynthesis C-methylase UbiE